MRIALIAAAAALTLPNVPALAETTAPAPAASEPAAKPAKPKRICRSDPRATGTRIPRRICKTEDEWAKPQDGQSIQTQGRGGNPDPGSSTGPFGR